MAINKKKVKFQIDSGATCNVISTKDLNRLGDIKLEKSEQKLCTYNKEVMSPVGQCKVKMTNPKNGRKYKCQFVVIDNDKCNPIIGSKAAQAMELIEVKYENIDKLDCIGDIVTEFEDVFTGTGMLKGEYHMKLDEHAVPTVHPPRRVPVALKPKLKAELDRLQKLNIISPVTEPTKWVNSMVIVDKPNKLRICLDPKNLNGYLQRSHYPIQTIEEILPDLKNAKVFTVVDARNGFWQVKLDEESSFMTTFNTPYGRFRWLRMPFGITSASEEFQRRQNEVIEGLPGVCCIIDDILVYGEGVTENEAEIDHHRKLRSLLERCRERNLKLNKDKLKLCLKEVKFMGHVITSEGLKPDPVKVKAVVDMPAPHDITSTRSLLSFVSYLAKFLPKLSEISEPIRSLTRKEVDFDWSQEQENALTEIKKLITAEPVLRYYNAEEDLILQSDSSQYGMGACIMQAGKPIAYASRTLNDTERKYAQIEKELLSVIFGLERFHQYTYGRLVKVQSDHKPLEAITKKNLHDAPKRIQRMLLRMQKYETDITFTPGKQMHIADALSRVCLKETDNSMFTRDVENVNMLSEIPITSQRMEEVKNHTAADVQMQKVVHQIMNGWPQNQENVPQSIIEYFNIRDQLSYQEGIILKGERIVIPKSLRADMITRVHTAHVGVEGCTRRARDCLFWPGMANDIKTFVERCETCRTFETSQQKEPIIQHEFNERPFSKVGIDIFIHDEKSYLITSDYYSNFFEIDYLEDTTSGTVIHKLRAQFSRYGIPQIVMSDNGPQFSSGLFKTFAKDWKFKHETSSPLFAQSNGKAENNVKTAKRIMKKAKHSKSDPYLALLEWRNTPTQGYSTSPAQRMLNRRTNSVLPMLESKLIPKAVDHSETQKERKKDKQRQAYYYNKGTRNLTELKSGDVVRIQPVNKKDQWKKGVVENKTNIRSYTVKTESGHLRRNRRHLRFTQEKPSTDQPDGYPTAPEDNAPPDIPNTYARQHRNKESSATPENTTPPTVPNSAQPPEPQQPVTRCGRSIRAPTYLSDYNCD